MKPFMRRTAFLLVVFLFVIASSCSPASDPAPTSAPQPTQPPPPTEPAQADPTAVPEPESGAVSDIQDVKGATVQIQAEGTFVDPEVGLQVNAAGRGTGFIIDPSGLAVTNNHVVTGAALLKVWVGGEGQPRNAKVLGVSECSDLAVIDIEGDGYPYLEWYDEPINVGLDLFVAGYPLGDPEFTLTRGIVSKAQADGETNWSSVESVLEYDANSNPGNSGGPVVNEAGKVVAVHYAGNSSARQAFGISRDTAQGVIERLQTGEDVNSIGINGTAVLSEDGSISGIWVASVKSGSPADTSGIRAGDILVSMEGLVLATDGTMADYCDILRSHHPEDTLTIEVLRFETQEFLEGQLNGRALEPRFSFAQELEDEVGDETQAPGAGYSSYTMVSDEFGAIQMRVPVEWVDVDGSQWVVDDEVIGSAITAAGNVDGFRNTWTESGVFFGASDDLARFGGYVQLLDITREDFSTVCDNDGRFDYEDALYLGKYDLYGNCGGEGTTFLILSAVAKEDRDAFLILVEVQIVQDADLDALDQILSTFEVVGTLP
jgi:serine protease Do